MFFHPFLYLNLIIYTLPLLQSIAPQTSPGYNNLPSFSFNTNLISTLPKCPLLHKLTSVDCSSTVSFTRIWLSTLPFCSPLLQKLALVSMTFRPLWSWLSLLFSYCSPLLHKLASSRHLPFPIHESDYIYSSYCSRIRPWFQWSVHPCPLLVLTVSLLFPI